MSLLPIFRTVYVVVKTRGAIFRFTPGNDPFKTILWMDLQSFEFQLSQSLETSSLRVNRELAGKIALMGIGETISLLAQGSSDLF